MGILTPGIKDFIKNQKLGFFATVCPDGTPNLSPKATTAVWDDDNLVFANIHSPGTVNNLLANPAIEVCMVDVFRRKGYRFKGVATVLSDGHLFEKVMAFYKTTAEKYPIKSIVLIKVEKVLPVASPIYDTETSEAEVIDRWIEYWNSLYPGKRTGEELP